MMIHDMMWGIAMSSTVGFRPNAAARRAVRGAPIMLPNGPITGMYEASSRVMLRGKSSDTSIGIEGEGHAKCVPHANAAIVAENKEQGIRTAR